MNVIRHELRRCACIMMVMALFLLTGGHLALLQGFAWAKMLHDFSRHGSLTQAVSKTFDGHHQCPLCKKIAKTRTAEEKTPPVLKADKKAELFVSESEDGIPHPISRPFAYGPPPFVKMTEPLFAPPFPVPIGWLS